MTEWITVTDCLRFKISLLCIKRCDLFQLAYLDWFRFRSIYIIISTHSTSDFFIKIPPLFNNSEHLHEYAINLSNTCSNIPDNIYKEKFYYHVINYPVSYLKNII